MQKFIHTFMQTRKPLSTSQGKKLFTKGTWVSAEQNLNEGRRTDRKAMQTHANKHFHHTSMDMCWHTLAAVMKLNGKVTGFLYWTRTKT